MRAATIITGVFTQVEEFLDIHVPGLEVGADRALAFAALIDRNSGVIHHFQERYNTLRFAIGAFDMRTQRAHRSPVITQATRILCQQCILFDGFVNAVQIIRHRGQVAGGELRAQGAGIKQRWCRAHEIEGRQQMVELDCARLAIDFVERQTHGNAHVERLRHFDTSALNVQEVAVIQSLQTQVTELQITIGNQRLGKHFQIELRELGIEQISINAFLDEFREVVEVSCGRVALGYFLTKYFFTNGMHQQARRDLAIGRVFFHQHARCQNGRFVELFNRHAVIKIAYCLMQDRISIRKLFQSYAGRGDHSLELVHVERYALSIDHDQ